MVTQKKSLLAVAFLSVALAACSDGKNDVPQNTEADPSDAIQAGSGFDEQGLPGARLSALLEDVVEPDALSELSSVTMSAQIWLDSIDANIPPEYFTSSLPESDAVSQTFDCGSGSVSRKKWGNPIAAKDSLLFDACLFEGNTFDGSVLITNQSLGCSGGESISFEMAEYNLVTASGNQFSATGSFNYGNSVQNCGSSAGGPPGFNNSVTADMTSLSFGAGNAKTTYANYQLFNHRQEISAGNAGNEHTIELSVTIDAGFLNDQASEQASRQVIDVEFIESMKITSAVAEPNKGVLKIDNGSDLSVTYAVLGCAKDMAMITIQSTDAQPEAMTVGWFDDRNVLAALSVPGVRDNMTGAEVGIRESTYDANQSIDGC